MVKKLDSNEYKNQLYIQEIKNKQFRELETVKIRKMNYRRKNDGFVDTVEEKMQEERELREEVDFDRRNDGFVDTVEEQIEVNLER